MNHAIRYTQSCPEHGRRIRISDFRSAVPRINYLFSPAYQEIMTEQANNQNSHPDNLGIPQFCIFTFNFCILKLTIGQFELFMQNKANFQKSQMNVTTFIATDYENKSNWTLGENEPNTNPNEPNQSQFPKRPK